MNHRANLGLLSGAGGVGGQESPGLWAVGICRVCFSSPTDEENKNCTEGPFSSVRLAEIPGSDGRVLVKAVGKESHVAGLRFPLLSFAAECSPRTCVVTVLFRERPVIQTRKAPSQAASAWRAENFPGDLSRGGRREWMCSGVQDGGPWPRTGSHARRLTGPEVRYVSCLVLVACYRPSFLPLPWNPQLHQDTCHRSKGVSHPQPLLKVLRRPQPVFPSSSDICTHGHTLDLVSLPRNRTADRG
ncbi:uncharacterized protein LOC122238474 [Panthera tigris]|uniref:uncharacterized protein LOC122238474 n=1 Tax=Panthera tigris TaxID=9694 RepID=UPI001C6F7118|nr:uncharacterized protein LOC122238474 [Panthera tigris]